MKKPHHRKRAHWIKKKQLSHRLVGNSKLLRSQNIMWLELLKIKDKMNKERKKEKKKIKMYINIEHSNSNSNSQTVPTAPTTT